MILSSGEADSVHLLTDATPGLHVGYDPCHGDAVAALESERRLRRLRDAGPRGLAARPK